MSEEIPLCAESKQNQLEDNKKGINKGWIVAVVVVASQVMICKGLFISISGSMLQFLVANTASRVDYVTTIFSAREIGICVGAITFSCVKTIIQDTRPMLSSGTALLVLGSVAILTPFVHSVMLLIILNFSAGFMFGFSNSGLQSMYLTEWGELGSRPYIQLHHFSPSIGTFLAPLIAKPFLEVASQQPHHQTCSTHDLKFLSSTNVSSGSSLYMDSETWKESSWPYFIIGSYTGLVSIFCFIIGRCRSHDHIIGRTGVGPETRPEGRLRELWLFFVAVILFKFCGTGSATVYQSFISAVAACSNLKMNTVICVWGEHLEIVTWISTFVVGISLATLIPSGISWSAQVTNMTGKYIFVFTAGGTLGTAVMQPVAGVIFEILPFSVMYLIAANCVATVLLFILMNIMAPQVK